MPKPTGPAASVPMDAHMTGYYTASDGVPVIQVRIGRVKPNNQAKPGPIGNTQGIIVPETSPNPNGNSAPIPQAPPGEQQGWWKSWGSAVTHGVLDVVGMIPVVGEPANLIGAGIYALEGDYVSAGMDLAAMWPAGGQAATAAKYGRKAGGAVLEQAEKRAAQEAAQAAEKRALKEAEERAAREAEQAVNKNAANGTPPAKKNSGGKVNGGPCDHLRQGKGKGPYRGGAHSKTSQPVNDGKDSHHMPADDVSPLRRSEGPAIQMDPSDHKKTKSNGSMPGSAKYRGAIEKLLNNGEWRRAMATEIQDVRRIQRQIGDPTKYNEAMLEMLEYFKCLEKNGLLP